MISINKTEKMQIEKKFPDAHVVRTMKGKSKRHHYFAEETCKVVSFINQMRGIDPRRL